MTTANMVITGAGKRFGFHLAQAYQQRGFQVYVSYRTHRPQIDELEQLGVNCFQADFQDDEQIQAFIAHIHSQCQTIRALIHNASDWLPDNNELSPSQTLSRMLQVHAQAPFCINHELAPLLRASAAKENGSADLIHMTDYIVDKGSKKHMAYAASKAALANLTLSFASLLAPEVKVNNIAPALLKFNDYDDTAYRQKTLKKSAMQVEPGWQEGIAAVEYLLQSVYMTGRTLHLDGGRNVV
ncbi:dihydromonapterin reductase [Thalassotalea mangrovi]|uniref:Dihydromonapterin reductase n=1 Tax=Thalassotalea mangrovi TaxID=2572245 RepID=A0A4U1BAZ0_9GAMM|nr:dihydromonapterin reductase [Thalassotalea mangrovi]TKB47715.1 dihydromonapterin reductase [Thalassotalea mangrovi]